jgi:hypothetical protein
MVSGLSILYDPQRQARPLRSGMRLVQPGGKVHQAVYRDGAPDRALAVVPS